ncbi:MAG: DUF7594 domain-containing protein [Actinomycetota bacterium]
MDGSTQPGVSGGAQLRSLPPEQQAFRFLEIALFAKFTAGLVVVATAVVAVSFAIAPAEARVDEPFRAFSAESYWNTPLSADAPVDPNSDAFLSFLIADNEADYLRLVGTDSTGSWGEPIYWATPSDPLYNVKPTRYTLPPAFESVRIPREARPPRNSDAQITIYDVTAGSVYKLHRATYDSATDTWSAGGGSWYSMASNGLHRALSESDDRRNYGHRGIPPATHAVRYDEIRAGRINHVLKIAVNTAGHEHVWPMTGSDGDSRDPAALPQGARLRIKPGVDLEELNLRPDALTIARTLQRYGAVVGDSSGSNTNLKVENTVLEGKGWLWKGRLTATSLQAIPFSRYEVVRLGYNPPPHREQVVEEADVQRFTVAADASVTPARPQANLGTHRRLYVDVPRARGLLKFRLSALDGPVEKATLRVLATRAGPRATLARVRDVVWRERRVTWRSAPPLGEVVTSTGRLRKWRWVSVDVTSIVKGNGTYGFALTSSRGGLRFASGEADLPWRAPKLVVETR